MRIYCCEYDTESFFEVTTQEQIIKILNFEYICLPSDPESKKRYFEIPNNQKFHPYYQQVLDVLNDPNFMFTCHQDSKRDLYFVSE